MNVFSRRMRETIQHPEIPLFLFPDLGPITWHPTTPFIYANPLYSFPQEKDKEGPIEEIESLDVLAQMLRAGLDGASEISPRKTDREGKFSSN